MVLNIYTVSQRFFTTSVRAQRRGALHDNARELKSSGHLTIALTDFHLLSTFDNCGCSLLYSRECFLRKVSQLYLVFLFGRKDKYQTTDI